MRFLPWCPCSSMLWCWPRTNAFSDSGTRTLSLVVSLFVPTSAFLCKTPSTSTYRASTLPSSEIFFRTLIQCSSSCCSVSQVSLFYPSQSCFDLKKGFSFFGFSFTASVVVTSRMLGSSASRSLSSWVFTSSSTGGDTGCFGLSSSRPVPRW